MLSDGRGLPVAGILLLFCFQPIAVAAAADPPPNIVLIVADDLGYGELGCYGQKHIRTPRLDRLAAEGMRLTRHYSGSTVCAPSRCTLLTGLHTGHALIRDNYEMQVEGQLPLSAGTLTLGGLFRAGGYRTALIGKWGLGGPESSGLPNAHGFDHWFGYLCQRQAHNYYPTHLWRNRDRVDFPDHSPGNLTGAHYAPDLMIEEAVAFIRESRAQPFMLLYETIVPHLALQVPAESMAQYAGHWPEMPYDGSRGYLPHPTPRAAYAAMVTRMDRDIGRLLDTLDDLQLAANTLVMFTSDNGPTFDIGGADSDFFESTAGLRGRKCDLYEGGIRVPFIARWPKRIRPASRSEHVCAFWDLLPTLADAAGLVTPTAVDGISFLPTLLGEAQKKVQPYLYWEYRSRGGNQAILRGRWKGLRLHIARNAPSAFELYDLKSDPAETTNVAARHPQVVRELKALMHRARTPSEFFPLPVPAVPLPDAALVDQSTWTVVAVDSESTFNGRHAAMAFDGNPATHWHTAWKDESPGHPHEIVIDLGSSRRISGLRMLPRTDGGTNGTVDRFELYCSETVAFGKPVVVDRFGAGMHEKQVRFAPLSARYVKLRTLSEQTGKPFACIAELNVIAD